MLTLVWKPGATPGTSPVTQFKPVLRSIQGEPSAGTLEEVDPDTLTVSEFGDVYTAILNAKGAVDLVIDSTVGPAIVPANASIDGAGLLTLRGVEPTVGGSNPTIVLTDGSQIIGVAGVSGLIVVANPKLKSPLIPSAFCVFRSAFFLFDSGGAVPTKAIIGAPDGARLNWQMNEGCSLDNSFAVGVPICTLGTTGGGAACVLALSTYGDALQLAGVATNSITKSHAAVGTVTWSHDQGTPLGYLQAQCPALTGVSEGLLDLYQPAVTGDWTGADPTTVQGALDRLAAALGPIA